jgi:hypothetical protein
MEEAPEWLEEEHADDLGEEAVTEEEDVPRLVDTKIEEEIDLPVEPMLPPPPRRVRVVVGLGYVGTLSPSPSTSTGPSGATGASTSSSSRVPP